MVLVHNPSLLPKIGGQYYPYIDVPLVLYEYPNITVYFKPKLEAQGHLWAMGTYYDDQGY